MLLGAPGRKMKMQFLAVFFSATLAAIVRACSRLGLMTSAKYDATMPVPATCRKRRREKPGPREKPLALSQVGHSIFDFGSFGWLMVRSSIAGLQRWRAGTPGSATLTRRQSSSSQSN